MRQGRGLPELTDLPALPDRPDLTDLTDFEDFEAGPLEDAMSEWWRLEEAIEGMVRAGDGQSNGVPTSSEGSTAILKYLHIAMRMPSRRLQRFST